jgi:hypothetical protein
VASRFNRDVVRMSSRCADGVAEPPPKEVSLARYIDHHPTNANMPPEVISIIRKRLLSGEPDEFGDRGISVFIGTAETFCYTEAPSKEAVRKAHAAIGIDLDHTAIAEVQVLP